MITKGKFKLVGLSKPKSMTCEPLDKQDCFWPKVNLSQERFDALWQFKKDHWNEPMFVEIEYDRLTADGIPINGTVVNTILEP